MLGGVAGPEQVLGRAIMRQNDKLASPVGCGGNLARPI